MSSSRAIRARIVSVAAPAACGAAFAAMHVVLFARWLGPMIDRAPASSPLARTSLVREGVGMALSSLAAFSAFAAASIAMANKTRDRLVWTLPVLGFVCSPLPFALLLQDGRPVLRPLIEAAGVTRPTLVALAELVLVLLAALPFALRNGRARRPETPRVVAFAACAAIAMTVWLVRQYGASGSFDVNVATLAPLAFAFCVGAALGTRRPWFPAVHILVAVLGSAEAVAMLLEWVLPHDPAGVPLLRHLTQTASAVLPAVAAAGLGALSDPLARLFGRRAPAPSLPARV